MCSINSCCKVQKYRNMNYRIRKNDVLECLLIMNLAFKGIYPWALFIRTLVNLKVSLKH